jgi:hypothetical protein
MSRQKGRRSAPRPDHDAYVESLHRRGRRERVRLEPTDPITQARRWGAVAVASVMLLFAFAGVVTAIVDQDRGDTSSARSAIIIAAVIAPMAMYSLGLVSRAPTPLRTMLVTAPASMAGFALVAALLREPATAVVAAFGVGGAFTLRADEGVHSIPRRISIVGVLAVLTLVIYRVVPDATIIVAPLFPFAACAAADVVSERSPKAVPD